MSTTEAELTRTRRPFFRFWLPRLLLILTVLDIALIWLVPAEGFEGGLRLIATVGSLLVFYLLFSLWLFIFSGYTWKRRWATFFLIPLIVIGVRFALVQGVHFTGDMTPIVRFRWE